MFHPQDVAPRHAPLPCAKHCVSGLFGWARLSLKGLVLLIFVHAGLVRSAFATCTAPQNPIEAENCLPGTPASQWYVDGVGSPNIQGFATDISVNAGQTISFKVSTNASSWRMYIYRLGYYQGNDGRFITSISPSVAVPQIQPSCLTDSSTGLVDCGNWAISASWTVPSNATSGVYFGRLVRLDTGEAGALIFVVRNDSSHSDILVQTSDTTWQAYNDWGGNSLYVGNPAGRAYKVSYNRPVNTLKDFFSNEYNMLHWLEANGYDVSYFTGVDADRNGSVIIQHRVFMSVGHDEYWSRSQRANVEAGRAAGVNLAFLSGNEVGWKTRWEASIDGTNTPFRTLVCYKESFANALIDPQDPPTWTGLWRDPRFSPPADGDRPENALTGTISDVTAPSNDPITVPQDDARMRFWRNTSVAALAPGQFATLPTGVLGYEWDENLENGFQPAGLIPLSTTTRTEQNYVYYSPDSGYYAAPGTATHHLSLYRAPSGALVFSAGTIHWSWGIDDDHVGFSGSTANLPMRQANVNLLADMGVQPATPESGLVPATPSADTAPPKSTIASPVSGGTITAGSPITISGTAADLGGGVVGAVEISTDGGATWHRAVGRENWSYTHAFGSTGTLRIQTRAVDDSGNLEVPSPGITLTVVPAICPCTIWPSLAVPAIVDAGPYSPLEVGVQFRSDNDGYITGIRFYKGDANTGTHVANLWSGSGTLLATATFTGETGSGWQQVNFSNPVAITANTTYVASYHSSTGYLSMDLSYFATSGADSAPLHASANTAGGKNGLYTVTSTDAFPVSTYNSANFWIDVVFNYNTALSSLTLNPTSVLGAVQSSSGTVTLSGPTPSGGTTIALSSSNTVVATVPTSVTVPAGATSASFTVNTSAVGTTTSVTITAVYGSVTQTASLIVTPPAPTSLTLSPSSLTGGNSSSATVTLNGPAPSGGAVVALSSNNTGVATVPSSVTVPAGATSAAFTMQTSAVATATSVTISAVFGGVTQSASLTVVPPVLASLKLNPSSVTGGNSATGTVTLSGPAPSDGAVVALSSSNILVAMVPASVTIAAGSTSASFSISTLPVLFQSTVTISASYRGTTLTATLTVSPLL
jgi:hypothetical protein